MISKVEVERFSLTSARSFDEVLALINGAVGRPEMAEFWSSGQHARTVGELKDSIRKVFGRTGLMSFLRFDHGAIVRKATGAISPGWSARHGHGRRWINGNEDQNRRETRDENKETQHRLLPR